MNSHYSYILIYMMVVMDVHIDILNVMRTLHLYINKCGGSSVYVYMCVSILAFHDYEGQYTSHDYYHHHHH